MKEYATLKTEHIDQETSVVSYHSVLRGRTTGLYPPCWSSLDTMIKAGWKVIATGIQVGHCSHSATQFIFILERVMIEQQEEPA